MLRKLPEVNRFEPIVDLCNSPNHNPPMNMVYEPGSYEWTCPQCHKVEFFIVTKIER